MTVLSWSVDEQNPIYARSGEEIKLPDHRKYAKIAASLTRQTVLNFTNLALASLGMKRGDVVVRSVSEHPYDCVGMIFSNRRALITIDSIHKILENDGYNKIEEEYLVAGDIVLYANQDGPSHVGMIIFAKTKGVKDIRVLSKWGYAGEVEHHLHVVPKSIGSATEFWTERAPYVTG